MMKTFVLIGAVLVMAVLLLYLRGRKSALERSSSFLKNWKPTGFPDRID